MFCDHTHYGWGSLYHLGVWLIFMHDSWIMYCAPFYTHTCTHTCTHTHIHTHTCTHTHTHMYTHMHTHTHTHMDNTCTHKCTHTHTCTHKCAHTHMHTYMCTHIKHTRDRIGLFWDGLCNHLTSLISSGGSGPSKKVLLSHV